jgi:predicted Zn-dependent peptidase
MQKHEKVKLKNGLDIHFLFDKAFTTSSIQMCFKVGWRNDVEEYRGLAHLFEHLVGKRTKNFPGKSEFAQVLEQKGIVFNAFTSPDVTVYWQNQTNDNLLISLEYLFEAIYNSEFEDDDLEKEKKVVTSEAVRILSIVAAGERSKSRASSGSSTNPSPSRLIHRN